MNETKNNQRSEVLLSFTKIHYILLLISVIISIIGFILLGVPPADGFISVTLAPIILVLNFCVFLPFIILYSKKK